MLPTITDAPLLYLTPVANLSVLVGVWVQLMKINARFARVEEWQKAHDKQDDERQDGHVLEHNRIWNAWSQLTSHKVR